MQSGVYSSQLTPSAYHLVYTSLLVSNYLPSQF
jgi:hypothetical protein